MKLKLKQQIRKPNQKDQKRNIEQKLKFINKKYLNLKNNNQVKHLEYEQELTNVDIEYDGDKAKNKEDDYF